MLTPQWEHRRSVLDKQSSNEAASSIKGLRVKLTGEEGTQPVRLYTLNKMIHWCSTGDRWSWRGLDAALIPRSEGYKHSAWVDITQSESTVDILSSCIRGSNPPGLGFDGPESPLDPPFF